jgi:hypothetical protein
MRVPAALLAVALFAPGKSQSATPWLWEARKAGGTVWIAGALHVGKPEDTRAFSAYLPVYRKASTVYFETLPGSEDSLELQRYVAQAGVLPAGVRLDHLVGNQTWRNLEAAFGGDLDRVSTMQPWLAAFTLIQRSYSAAGLRQAYGLDAFIQRLAIRDAKRIGGLETLQGQLSALAGASRRDQVAFLIESLHRSKATPSRTAQLRRAWVTGDTAALISALDLDEHASQSAIHRNLIEKRNRRWVRKLGQIVNRQETALVVVGIEHLIASPALPKLLREAGFVVVRFGE